MIITRILSDYLLNKKKIALQNLSVDRLLDLDPEEFYKFLYNTTIQELVYTHNIKEFEKLDFIQFKKRFLKDEIEKGIILSKAIRPFISGLVILLISFRLKQNFENITLERSFSDDLGMDSLSIVDLILHFEEILELDIPDSVVPLLYNIEDAVKYIYSYFLIEMTILLKIGILSGFNSEFELSKIPPEIVKNLLFIFQKEFLLELEEDKRFFTLPVYQFVMYMLLSDTIRKILLEWKYLKEETPLSMQKKIKDYLEEEKLILLIDKLSHMLELRTTRESLKKAETFSELVFDYIKLLTEV